MVQTEGNQPLGKRKRNQPLRRRARNVELARDLVLGVAGDVIEPAGARRVIEAGPIRTRRLDRRGTIWGLRRLHAGSNSARESNMRSAPAAVNWAATSRVRQWLPPTKPHTVIAAALPA